MTSYQVTLLPLDPVLFGDNRSAAAGLIGDQDPSMLTFYGAVGTALIQHNGGAFPTSWLGKLQTDVLSPNSDIAEIQALCLVDPSGKRWFVKPESLQCAVGMSGVISAHHYLSIKPSEGHSGAYPALAESTALISNPAESVLVSEAALSQILCQQVVHLVQNTELQEQQTLYKPDARPGIQIDPDQDQVASGQFFSRPYRRFSGAKLPHTDAQLSAGYALYYQTLQPVSPTSGEVEGFIGGDRRRMRLTLEKVTDVFLVNAQQAVRAELANSTGFLLYLLTPAIRDIALTEVELGTTDYPVYAAALGHNQRVSGWDNAQKCPRPLHTIVPSGSVYYFKWPDSIDLETQEAVLDGLWLSSISSLGAAVGFGRCLVGVWS